jgi:peptide/nickel transport system substrate-binding protein
MITKLLKITCLTLLLLTMLLSSCMPSLPEATSPAQPEIPPQGGSEGENLSEPESRFTQDSQAGFVARLRLPGGTDWGFPAPFGFNRGPGYVRASLIFDTLLWRDSQGTIPWLASEWSVSEDGVTWTFTLRDDVKWHDGKPLTADDVVFSVSYYHEFGTPWFMSPVDEIEKAEALSPHLVAITLKRPFAPFIPTIAEAMFILPKHIWEGVDNPRVFRENEATIGSGAYQLADYSQAEGTYRFVANPDFFLGMPYVRQIEFIPVSDDLLALQNNQIAAFDKFGGVNDEMLEPFKQPPYQIKTAGGEWGTFLFFNLTQEGSPVQNIKVRQAIAHSLDRDEIVQRILLGFGQPGSAGFLPPSNPYYKLDLPNHAFDLDTAKSLLTEAGYSGDENQGWLDAQGQTLSLTLTFSNTTSPRLVEFLVNSLKQVGIPLELKGMDQAGLDAAATEGRYEMLLVGFGGLGGDPDQLSRTFASFSKMEGFARARGYANPEFDELARQQIAQFQPTERAKLIDQMQTILAGDLPVFALYYTDRVVAFNADVFDNWYFTPGGYGGGIPMPFNKHQFIVGQAEGIEIRK